MSSEPPPLPPRYRGKLASQPETVRVEEDPVPLTQRLPAPPRLPREPFRLLDGRKPSYVEFSAQLSTFQAQLNKVALQLDGHGQTINQRFDIFHRELALLRADHSELLGIVSGDHGPRIDKVETTLGQKAARGGGIAALVVVALPMLAEALPKYRHIIEAIAGAFR